MGAINGYNGFTIYHLINRSTFEAETFKPLWHSLIIIGVYFYLTPPRKNVIIFLENSHEVKSCRSSIR